MRKGYIFVLDASLAFLLVVAVLSYLSYTSFKAETVSWETINQKRLANNIMSVMDRNGTLQTLNQGTIESDVNLYLPRNLQMRVKVEKYEFNDANGSFNLVSTTTAGPSLPSDNRQVLFGRRLFVTVEDSQAGAGVRYTIDYYYNAEWWLWQK